MLTPRGVRELLDHGLSQATQLSLRGSDFPPQLVDPGEWDQDVDGLRVAKIFGPSPTEVMITDADLLALDGELLASQPLPEPTAVHVDQSIRYTLTLAMQGG